MRARRGESHAGLMAGLDPKRLDEAGWGVIFPRSWDLTYRQDVRAALAELLDRRKTQAGDYYREIFSDELAYRSGESKLEFLSRFGVKPGPADPRRMPYYLLIVGDPAAIPFAFQHELDIMYAAGRIYFDTLQEYANYAHSVVLLERFPGARSAAAGCFCRDSQSG